MVRHVSSRDCMARRAGNFSGGSIRHASRSRMGSEGRFPSLGHGCFAARPSPCRFDCPSRSVILRILGGEQRKNMFGAVRRPAREQAVARHVKQAAAMGSYETWIPSTHILSHLRRTPSYLPEALATVVFL
jgi:hypothetical protein